jgi:uncharacterized RDD family membrane protein YckC
MRCQKCGAESVAHASYCSVCGYQLVIGDSNNIVYRDYAGFWKRFGAMIIDSILLTIISSACAVLAGVVFGMGMMGAAFGSGQSAAMAVMAAVGYYGFAMVLNWLYFTLMESSEKQATFGKLALGIIVTDVNGNRISFGKANVRYWSKLISSFILFIGYIMAAFTEKKQGLHDMIASTLVVDN